MPALHNTFWVDHTMSNDPTSLYRGARVSFLTQHGKEMLVQKPIQDALACNILHTDAYNTDLLGTFSRDIERRDSQRKTARNKALIGMGLLGTSIGLASEGSFVPDPFGGFMPWNIEYLLWLDRDRDIEVVGIAQGPARSMHRMVRTLEELKVFADAAGFPSHWLMLRPDHEEATNLFKGLSDWSSLKNAFSSCLSSSQNGVVFVENDLRAFANPTRQKMILKATEDLCQKLQSTCPSCHTPGYWMTDHKTGLPCRQCLNPTPLPVEAIWRCQTCHHEERRAINSTPFADPSRCLVCNP